jgi:histidine ammonia-lyase
MGPIAARHARSVLAHVQQIVAIELLVAAQALDVRVGADGPTPGAGVDEARRRVRAGIPRLDRDREPGPDIAAAADIVRTGVLVDLVGP